MAESIAAEGTDASLPRPLSPGAFLLIVDPQVIFADPASDWASPFWEECAPRILELARAFNNRVIVTRWLPTADRSTAWGDYFKAWPFADVPADDPLYALLPEFEELSPHPVVDEPTFGKWGQKLQRILAAAEGESPGAVVSGSGAVASGSAGVSPGSAGVAGAPSGAVASGSGAVASASAGPTESTVSASVPDIVVTGVSTDCCVISTVLPAADAGARITVVSDACAASTAENGAAAMHVMGLYPPQVQIASTAEVLAALR